MQVRTEKNVTPLPESATSLPPLGDRSTGGSYGELTDALDKVVASGQPSPTPFVGSSPPNFYAQNPAVFQPVPGSAAAGTTLDILRRRNTVPPGVHQNQPSQWVGKTTKKANAQQYEAEYWEEAIKDPAKRMWLAKRAIMLGFAKYDPTSQWMVSEDAFTKGGVYQMWKQAGDIVQMNPTLNQMTPEEYLDSMYGRLGGDQGLQTGIDAQKALEPDPIQKTTQVSKYSMSSEQAAAIADQVATAALGRMASEGEMAKARKAMNRLMAANPTVSTTVSDATDPNNVKVSTNTKSGVGPDTAAQAYEMKLKRSSEGMAFNVGKLMETAMSQMDRGL